MARNHNKNRIANVCLLLLVAYVGVSLAAYRVSHPEQTETQLWLNMWQALTWRR